MKPEEVLETLSLSLMAQKVPKRAEFSRLFAALEKHACDATHASSIKSLRLELMSTRPDFKKALAVIQNLSEALETEVVQDSNQIQYETGMGSEIFDSYASESAQHLQSIEQSALLLEKDQLNSKTMESLLGAFHSLKGISGFVGLHSVHKLAHETESVLVQARGRGDGVRTSEADAVLRVVDLIRSISNLVLEHVKQPDGALPKLPDAYAAMLSELENLIAKGKNSEAIGVESKAGATQTPAATERDTHLDISRPNVDSALEIRVKVEKLDLLIDGMGELSIAHEQLEQSKALQGIRDPLIRQRLVRMDKIIRQMQDTALSLRMLPLKDLFHRMRRLARDIARSLDRNVEIFLVGEQMEMDKNLIEALVDPLTHLIRNSIDHGIGPTEARKALGKDPQGKLRIGAYSQGGRIFIEVEDDGRGLQNERILTKARQLAWVGPEEHPADKILWSFIFRSGFSTAEKITELSGRGVGLDVVKSQVERLSGYVTVASEPGRFTRFTLSMPQTLSMVDGLIMNLGSERFLLPISSVVESLKPEPSQVTTVHERGEVIDFRGEFVPILRLHRYTNIQPRFENPIDALIVVVECGGEKCGLMVDDLEGQQQVVIKSLGERLQSCKGITGGAVMGNGRISLILDPVELLAASRQDQQFSRIQ